MLGIGIVGCGKIAQVRHIPEYYANDDAELIGYYDINYGRAQELAEKFGGKAYKTFDELLENTDIDAVSICTANSTHAKMTLKALSKDKHVLCEKPMATTLEDCKKMVKEAEDSGKILMIGQNQRLLDAHQKARILIKEGTIGKILSFSSVFGHSGPENWSVDSNKHLWFFDKQKATMGAMADLGIHKTDLLQYLMDDKIISVMAYMDTVDKCDSLGVKIALEDNAICIYKMAGGALGTMRASWTYYGEEDNSTILYGTEGIIKIFYDEEHAITVIHKNGKKESYNTGIIQTNKCQSYSGVIDTFIKSIQTGTQYISSQSVLNAMKAVFAAVESSEKGERVSI